MVLAAWPVSILGAAIANAPWKAGVWLAVALVPTALLISDRLVLRAEELEWRRFGIRRRLPRSRVLSVAVAPYAVFNKWFQPAIVIEHMSRRGGVRQQGLRCSVGMERDALRKWLDAIEAWIAEGSEAAAE